jgi:Zn-dependent protease with chaperone function
MTRWGTILSVVAFGLAAAASARAADYYLVDRLAAQATDAPTRAQARELERIYADLARVSGVEAKLIYSTDPDINAYATIVDGEKLVVVQEGLLANLGDDRDAVAATLGHELAHHKADHINAGRRKQEGVRVLGAILGAVVGAKIGRDSGDFAGAVSGAAVGVGANLLALKFNRSQELEADRLSIGWMIDAGYNPQGMLRLQREIGAMTGRRAAILSTHPTGKKRYDAADKLIAKLAPPPDLTARDAQPLVSDAALAEADGAIRTDRDARVAAAVRGNDAEPPAAALAPIDGVDFATFAALSNELVYAGDKGKPALLARYRLTDAKYAAISDGYTARMSEYGALRTRFSAGYFRATQGKLAPWGKDLADSYESGAPLELDPPYPLDVASALFAAMRERGAPNLDDAQQAAAERDVLAAHGLTYYDFLIGHNWWARHAKLAAVGGDTSLLSAYFGLKPTATAPADGVHVGDNVNIGKNVRIGGKEVRTADTHDE